MLVSGTWNFPMYVLRVMVCTADEVINAVSMVLRRIVLPHMGNTLSNIFSSSTCVTVQSLHGLISSPISPSVCTAALSRNLSSNSR
eukprot:Gb_30351 [translate_table: standard]